MLDGPPGVHWSGTRIVDTTEDARREVAAIADGGAEVIKTYFWLRPEPFAAVIEAAHGRGLPVAYHPGLVSVAEAVEMGVDHVEHLLHAADLLPASERDQVLAPVRDADWDSLPMFRLWDKVDGVGTSSRRLLDRMARAGTVLTPTLALSAAILNGPTGPTRRRHDDRACRPR